MVGNWRERSFTTRVYISTSSWASTLFAKRNLKPDSKVMESLEYINSCNHDICLISIGFAGLTTRSIDLVNLIETFAMNNEVFILDVQNQTKRPKDFRQI